MFKMSFEAESYLYTNLPRKVKKQFTKCRLSNHNLNIEKGRQENIIREDRLCTFCGVKQNANIIECEYHMLFECVLYEELRKQSSISFDKTLFNFVHIMSCQNLSHVNNLAWFIWKCFSLRNSELDK